MAREWQRQRQRDAFVMSSPSLNTPQLPVLNTLQDQILPNMDGISHSVGYSMLGGWSVLQEESLFSIHVYSLRSYQTLSLKQISRE